MESTAVTKTTALTNVCPIGGDIEVFDDEAEKVFLPFELVVSDRTRSVHYESNVRPLTAHTLAYYLYGIFSGTVGYSRRLNNRPPLI